METKNIYQKLLELQTKSIALKKDANNPFFKSKYITLDNIINTYNPILNELKLVCYHYTKENKLTTVILSIEDGSKIESEFNVLNTDPQKQGSEITYGKRYNLGQLLNIQTDLDDDANIASKAPTEKVNAVVKNVGAVPELGLCDKCGSSMKLSQAGKPYCSATCWKQ